MRRVIVIASAFAVSSFVPAMSGPAFAASDPTGVWINDTGRGAIEIKPCGEALCGNVVWVKDQADSKGCGKQILGDVAPAGSGVWDNGWIYSPERGRKFNVELKPLANGKLRVTGYAGVKFLSQTMIWTRAPENLQRCGAGDPQIEAKAVPPPAAAKPDASPAPATGTASDKAAPTPEVALAAPPPAAAQRPNTAPTDKPPGEASNAAKAPATDDPGTGPSARPQGAAPSAAGAQATAPPSSHGSDQKDEETASADDDGEGGSGLEEKLSGLGLGKVFTKTNGKCKVDLPWVKLSVDCE